MPSRAYRVELVGYENLSGLLDEVDTLPTRTKAALDEVLQMAFEDTQLKTHVITGSLKASGRSSASSTSSSWTGTITYGGPSAGPNNPVEYAIYEMARGGSHDFFSDFPVYEELMQVAAEEQMPR